jgi:hypothetical protein
MNVTVIANNRSMLTKHDVIKLHHKTMSSAYFVME